MAAAEVISIREVAKTVESFDGRSGPTRLRLPPDKARWLRYVLCEWEGNCGAGSNMGAQLEKLAQKPKYAPERAKPFTEASGEEVWRQQWARDAQTIYVPSTPPSHYEREWPSERWAFSSQTTRHGVLRAYRSLCALAQTDRPGVSVLVLLYGERPPGMHVLDSDTWTKDARTRAVAEDYMRVCRLFVESLSGWATARLKASKPARADMERELGMKCEHGIVRATQAYLAAWEACHVADRPKTTAAVTEVVREERPVGLMSSVYP